MTAQEYREWERAHVTSQPQANAIRAEKIYQHYFAFTQRAGTKKPLSRQRYELALGLVGFKGEVQD